MKTITTDQPEKDKIFTKFEKLFKSNPQIKDTEIKIQLKPKHPPVKQKTGPIKYHLKSYVGKEIDTLIQSGHLEKKQNLKDDCFASPVLMTENKNKTSKITLDSKKIKDSCIKMRPHMLNMDELSNQISTEITKVQNEPLCLSKVDFHYKFSKL